VASEDDSIVTEI